MMDRIPVNEELIIDVESCLNASREEENPSLSDAKQGKAFSTLICGAPGSVDSSMKGENVESLSINVKACGEVSPNTDKNTRKEKRKSTSAKKPPKPPRPPRGLPLDAADQKLIKELAEIAMIKRARIERMKALKKMKAAKASSSSWSGNFVAILFTILFCVVILFQGIFPRNSSAVVFHVSPASAAARESRFNLVHAKWNLSASYALLARSRSPHLAEAVPGSDSKDTAR